MRHFKGKVVSILSVFLILNLLSQVKAQVTIGSDKSPSKGALLELSNKETSTQDNSNATKGLGLPRVALENSKELYPMLKGDPVYDGADEGLKQKEKEAYSGLVVYNVADKDDLCPGVYIWEGVNWQNMMAQCISEISLNHQNITLYIGDNPFKDLKPIFVPSDATNQKVIWSTSSPWAISIDSDGVMEGLSFVQNAIVTATTEQGNKKATCRVSVSPPSPLSLDVPYINFRTGVKQTATLKPQIYPEHFYEKLTYTSNNPNIIVTREGTQFNITSNGLSPSGTKSTITIELPERNNKVTYDVYVLNCGGNGEAYPRTIGSNSYLTHGYRDQCWMLEYLREGPAKYQRVLPAPSSKSVFYYTWDQANFDKLGSPNAFPCPPGWEKPRPPGTGKTVPPEELLLLYKTTPNFNFPGYEYWILGSKHVAPGYYTSTGEYLPDKEEYWVRTFTPGAYWFEEITRTYNNVPYFYDIETKISNLDDNKQEARPIRCVQYPDSR